MLRPARHYPAATMRSVPLPRLHSRPRGITALWPVPNYTAWWTEAHVCEQLAQGGYMAVHRAGVEPATLGLQVRHATATPPNHIWTAA